MPAAPCLLFIAHCLLPAANCLAVTPLASSGNTPGDDDLLLMSPTRDSRPVKVSGVPQPYGLCDFGHQGLQDNREFNLWCNRARYGDPRGRWPVRDGTGYADGPNLYEYERSAPVGGLDPQGDIVVAFRGWEGVGRSSYRSDVTLAIVAAASSGEGKQEARHYRYDNDGFSDAEEFITQSWKYNICEEPIYVVGYSIGARTAFVLAQDLAAATLLRRSFTNLRHWEPEIILILLDYNWGAFTFTPPGKIREPLFPGPGHTFYSRRIRDMTKHVVSEGRLTRGKRGKGKSMQDHTSDVFRN